MRYISIVLFSLISGVSAAECPQSPPEFMRHLGRSLLPADRLAAQILRHPDSVTENEVAVALAGIDLAIHCSKLTLDDCGFHLLPERLQTDPGPYRAHMSIFIAHLEEYRTLIAGVLESGESAAVYAKKKVIQEFVTHAHGTL